VVCVCGVCSVCVVCVCVCVKHTRVCGVCSVCVVCVCDQRPRGYAGVLDWMVSGVCACVCSVRV